MDCLACHRQLPEGAAFCGWCGGALQTDLECGRCGTSNPAEMSFCMGCGAALRDAAAPSRPVPSGAPLPAAPAAPGAPASLGAGRYRVERLLGEGAKKRVYLARDTRLDRDVAISLLKSEGLDEGGRVRVLREAEAMGRLGDHPNIVTQGNLRYPPGLRGEVELMT